MFKAIISFRLKQIWKNVLSVWVIYLIALIIIGGAAAIQDHDVTEVVQIIRYGLPAGLFFMTELILLIEAFKVRTVTEFSLQNGISREITFWGQIISLFGSQVLTFAITYPLFFSITTGSIRAEGLSIKQFMLEPKNFLLSLLICCFFLANAFVFSSFITLFDKRIWWLIFLAFVVLRGIWRSLKYSLNIFNFVLRDNFTGTWTQLNWQIWVAVALGILVNLSLAYLCQHFLQTRRLNFGLVKARDKKELN